MVPKNPIKSLSTHHYPGVLPLCQLVQNPQQVNTACHVSPAENRDIANLERIDKERRIREGNSNLKGLCCQLWLFSNDTAGKVQKSYVVLAANVSHDVLVEELENKGNAVSKDQVLQHELELVDVVDLEVLQEEEENGRYSFDNDLLVSVYIDSKLHRLHHSHWHLLWQDISHDVDGVCLCLAGGSSSKKNLKESNHILWQ